MSAASPGVKSPLATASRIAARREPICPAFLGKSKELERRTVARGGKNSIDDLFHIVLHEPLSN
jgi:hypothetical protein